LPLLISRKSDTNQPNVAAIGPKSRLKMSPIKIYQTKEKTNDFLAAGSDPLQCNQEFSTLVNNPTQLMQLKFKKPMVNETPFPPILDIFSRTQAAPIISLKLFSTPSQRIAGN